MATCGDSVSWSNSDQGREWRWSCGTRAELLAIGMGDGKGEGGRGDTVHVLGAVKLPIIEAWSGLAGVCYNYGYAMLRSVRFVGGIGSRTRIRIKKIYFKNLFYEAFYVAAQNRTKK